MELQKSDYGVFAPTGTNPDIVAKVNKALQVAMKSKELYEQVVNEGGEPLFMSPEEYKKQFVEEANKWSSLIKKLNLKIENQPRALQRAKRRFFCRGGAMRHRGCVGIEGSARKGRLAR